MSKAREIIAEEFNGHHGNSDDCSMYSGCLVCADAILSALRAAGLVVVPVEPTDRMYYAFYKPDMLDGEGTKSLWKKRYAAAIAASQEDK